MTKKGYSLLELLVVIFILSILLFVIATTFYDKYKSQAYLEKDVMVYAKNCMFDLVAYCMENYNGKITPAVSGNCQNRTSLYGNVTVYMPSVNCNGSKLPEGFSVKFYSTSSKYYYVLCQYINDGIHCAIEPIK